MSYSLWSHKESDTTEWVTHTVLEQGFLGGSRGKNLPANAGNITDMGSIPGWGRSPGEGHGNPLPYSCLENPMDRGTWWATLHRIAKSQTWLKLLSTVLEQWNEPDTSKSANFPFVWGDLSCWVYLIKNVSDASYCPVTRIENMIEKKMLHFHNCWGTLLNCFWDKQCAFNFTF